MVTIDSIKGVNGKLLVPIPKTRPARWPGKSLFFKNADVVTHHVKLDDNSMETTDIAAGASSQPLAIGAINKAITAACIRAWSEASTPRQTPDPRSCTGYCG